MKAFFPMFPVLLLASFAQASAPGFGMQELLRAIERTGADTVEESVKLLPPSLRANFTLMHKSRSIQPGDAANPRAILFGEDGRFVVTFNNKPEHPGSQALEMIQFNDEQRRFEMFRLDFPLPRNRDGTLKPVEKNPAICLACHTADPHPIWAKSPLWPGAFGEFVDRIGHRDEKEFKAYLENRKSSPRYSLLLPPEGSWTSPYLPPRNTQLEPENQIQFQPNERLGLIFNRLNAKRLARRIEESENFEKYRTFILYTALNCQAAQYTTVPPTEELSLNAAEKKLVLAWVEEGMPPREKRIITGIREPLRGDYSFSDFLYSMDLFIRDASSLTLDIQGFPARIKDSSALFMDLGGEGLDSLVAWQLLERFAESEPGFKRFLIPAHIRYPSARPAERPILKKIYDLAPALNPAARYDACPLLKERLMKAAGASVPAS